LRRVRTALIMALVCFCLALSQAEGKDLKASVAQLPVLSESNDRGILIDLLKAMAEEYKDGKLSWEVTVPARAMDNVQKGKADFEIPQIVNPNVSPDKLPFRWSSDVIFKVVYGLYTNKNNKEINARNLKKFKIESLNGLEDFFDFPISSSPDIESGLKKVDLGRTDGWIFAIRESDQTLKKLNLKNIKRWEFKKYDVKMVLQKGPQGKEVDMIVSGLIKKLKAKGAYQRIMGPILDQKFEEWQP
jgi:polar amino acid transport system substrate-binding protein